MISAPVVITVGAPCGTQTGPRPGGGVSDERAISIFDPAIAHQTHERGP